MVNPPSLSPIYCPKECQTWGKQNYLKTFGFWLNPPPPIGQCLKEIRFFMASLIHLELGGLVSYSQPVYGVLDHGLLLTSYQDVTVVVKCRLTVRNFLSGLFI